MEEVKGQDASEPSSGSGCRENPQPVKCSSKQEQILNEWIPCWKTAVQTHACQSVTTRRWHTVIAIPALFLPLILAPVSSLVLHNACENPEDGIMHSMIISSGFALCAGLCAINSYFKWDVVAERHTHSSQQYGSLVGDAQDWLAAPRRDRSDSILALRNFKLRSDAIFREAPPLCRKCRNDLVKLQTPPYRE